MEAPEVLTRLARLVGRDNFVAAVGRPGDLRDLSPAQRAALHDLVAARLDAVASGLVGEAAASDDVVSGESALAFIDDRLAEFAGVLDAEVRARMRELAAKALESWE